MCSVEGSTMTIVIMKIVIIEDVNVEKTEEKFAICARKRSPPELKQVLPFDYLKRFSDPCIFFLTLLSSVGKTKVCPMLRLEAIDEKLLKLFRLPPGGV